MEGIRVCKLSNAVTGLMVFAAIAGMNTVVVQSQSPDLTCTNYMRSLALCMSSLTGNTSDDCCAALATVVDGGVTCLCQLMNNVNTFGFTTNRTFVLSLSESCKVKTPPVNQCTAADLPPDAPVASPESSPAEAPASATSPAVSTTEDLAPRAFSPANSPSPSLGPRQSPSSDAIPKVGGIDPSRRGATGGGSSGGAGVLPRTIINLFVSLILTSRVLYGELLY